MTQTYPNTGLLRNAFEAETGKPYEVYWEGNIENPAYTAWLEDKLVKMDELQREAFEAGAKLFACDVFTSMTLNREYNDWKEATQ